MRVFFKVLVDDHLFVWEGASMRTFNRLRKNPDRPVQAKRVDKQVENLYKDVFVAPEYVTYWWEGGE